MRKLREWWCLLMGGHLMVPRDELKFDPLSFIIWWERRGYYCMSCGKSESE